MFFSNSSHWFDFCPLWNCKWWWLETIRDSNLEIKKTKTNGVKLISDISNSPTFVIHSQQECKNTGIVQCWCYYENKIMPHREDEGWWDSSLEKTFRDLDVYTLQSLYSNMIQSAGLGFKPRCLLMHNVALHTSYDIKHCILSLTSSSYFSKPHSKCILLHNALPYCNLNWKTMLKIVVCNI